MCTGASEAAFSILFFFSFPHKQPSCAPTISPTEHNDVPSHRVKLKEEGEREGGKGRTSGGIKYELMECCLGTSLGVV